MSPEEFFQQHGPKFKSACPFAHCPQSFSGYTQRGVDALMAMHVDDHKRGIVSNKFRMQKLTPYDIAFLKENKVGWPEDSDE